MKLMKDVWLRFAGILAVAAKQRTSDGVVRGIALCMLAAATAQAANAQAVSTTTVQGTVYLANGQPGAGTLVLSWPGFTTAAGQVIAADSTTMTIPPDGFVTVSLAPNQEATPAGEYYTAIFYMSDGTVSTQYWVIPAAAQASLAQVQAQVMPAAQAVQAVNKAYVDQAIAELSGSQLTASGGTLSGPLYLSSDPTQALQAADKHYVDKQTATALPLTGGMLSGPVTATQIGAAYQVDQFPGADFGTELQACISAVNTTYGGTCDARNFTGSLSMGSNVTISTGNVSVQLPCATITTANQIVVAAGTRNVALHGCAMRGGSAANGSAGGTVLAYSGTGAMIAVGDPTYAVDTPGFHMDNVVINTTSSARASAVGLAAYRTQEMDLEDMYFLGNTNQTGMTLDGTGNYTGGTFRNDQFGGFKTAVNAIGHQVANSATTDWMNASTFVRLHIDCPTSNGSPVNGTYGVNLQQGDGNTFTGGDVEGCSTAMHLGSNAQNNTIVGLRNENSTNQVVADAGSAYNNWMSGGTMFTGQLIDNGTRNSFLDTFHRSFNGLNGDWFGSQQDTTLTNHFRLGTGAGNERGLLNRFQTDYGYRWTTGLSDATAGEQFYQVLDELNSVYRLSIGQYNQGQSNTNNQTVINAAGTGAVVLNGSTGAGTGGVIFGSGGPSETSVATISNAGNAQFNGTLQVGGTSQSAGTMTVRNNADAEVDYYLWPGLTASQKGSFTYKDWNGSSQWYMVKDSSNNWALNSATGSLDSFKAYQSANSGDTYIDTSNSSGHIRLNYESGSGAETDIYSGSSANLDAAFLGPTSIKFPGLAASAGHFCLQVDSSGYLTNTGTACGSGSGGNGTISSGNSGQIAYYTASGTSIGGMNAVPLSAGGTGASSASGAIANFLPGISSDGNQGMKVQGSATVAQAIPASSPYADIRAYGATIDGGTDIGPALNSAIAAQCASTGGISCSVLLPCGGAGCYLANGSWHHLFRRRGSADKAPGNSEVREAPCVLPDNISLIGDGGGNQSCQSYGPTAQIIAPNVAGNVGTAITATSSPVTFTPTFTAGTIANMPVNSAITIAGTETCSGSASRTAATSANVTFTASSCTDSSGNSAADRIPADAIINITGCSDASFNQTGIPVVAADFPAGITAWAQNAAASTATGCTIVGFNEDSFETVRITAVSDGTVTSTFAHKHSANDLWGMVAVAPAASTYSHHDFQNISVVGNIGVGFWGQHLASVTLTGMGLTATTNMTSLAAEFAGTGYATIKHSSFGAMMNRSCANNCYQSSYPFGFRCTSDTSAPWDGGCGGLFTAIYGSWIGGGIKVDNNGLNSGISPPVVTNVIFESPSANGVTIDPRSGMVAQFKLDSILLQDNFNAVPLCLVGYTDQGSGSGFFSVRNPNITATTACIVNKYYNGQYLSDNSDGLNLPTGRNTPVGTLTDGGATETEIPGVGASMGPSVIPYTTLPVTTSPSGWSCSGCTITTVPAPDGTTNAGQIVSTSPFSYVQIGTFTGSTYAGDHFIFGAWVRPGVNATSTSSAWGANGPFTIESAGTDTFADQIIPDVATPMLYGMNMNGYWWHPQVALATIATGETASHSIAFDLFTQGTVGAGNQFFQPFWIYIPASANIPIDEIERWRQELMHGMVPQNFTAGSGVAVTTAPIASPSFNVLTPSTGAVAPLGTVNLADWTNSGLANGNVPVWNAGTGKWTPGSLPNSVNSINGNSGAFTFAGSGISCSGTTCTVAGGTGSGTVQAGSEYSPTFYNQSGSSATVGGVTPFTGLGYWSSSAPPAAATAAQVVSAIGATAVSNATTAANFSGSLSGDVTGTQGATTVAKVNGGTVPASANALATNSSSQPVAASSHNLSVPANCVTSGSSNTYSCTSSPTFTPASGDHIQVEFNVANTGTSTLAVNGTAAATIRKWGNTSNLAAGDVQANHWISATYDGTYWQLEGQLGNANATQVNGTAVPTSASVLSSNSSKQLTAATTTGSGNVVLATSPALTTPTLGVASATSLMTTASSTLGGSANLFNNAAATSNLVEIQAGTSAAQTEEIQWQNYGGTAEWQNIVDTSYAYHIKDAANNLDRMTIYQGGGNTNINAGNGAYSVCLNCAASSGTSGLLVQNGAATPATVLTVTGSGNTTAVGFVSGKFLMGSGTMALAAGAAAGSGPAIGCATSHVCDGVSGTVTLTTGTSPTTGTLATLTFPSTRTNYANCVVSMQSATAVITTETWTESASAITVTANSAPAASTAYTVRYWCGGN